MKPKLTVLILLAILIIATGSVASAQGPPSGFRALTGAEAASFVLPGDVQLVGTLPLADGLTHERYQQYFGAAEVLGGQITLHRDGSGTITTVIGSHYPNIVPTNAVGLSQADAQAIVAQDIGAGGERVVGLLINPTTGQYFFRVETRRFASRFIHWIDAQSGQVLNKFDALASDHGIGVKGDTKSMAGLTTFHNARGHGAKGPHWDLFSTDNRQWTFDARNRQGVVYYVTDSDNHWDLVTTDRRSPGQPALIDAQYYANATDDYFQSRHGFNWQACYTRMQSVAHYSKNYNNAFWNGTYTVYGDGDGIIFRELSGGLDVVSHEHTHGVTDCTSDLIYQDESGALNESFSDILGNSAEFFADANALDPTVSPDWFIGEDVYLPADAVAGFRNMADPREDDDPDHYSERQIGGGDNGGVHTNSGISNHAFFLLVNGGQNAGCDNVGSNGHTHTADCNVVVTSIGLGDAERIFFLGFTALPSNATFCNARASTAASATSLFGAGTQQVLSTADAWEAVGVTAALCGS
ncbi:MAG: peptidase M4 family protein [Chloroflexi bacterium]|nr:peptidase M4 family protein [Chloroflexota bacterium]